MSTESPYWLHDAPAAVAWIAVNILSVFAAWRISGRLFPGDEVAGRLLHAVVAWCAAVVLVLTLLGTIGVLSGAGMLLCVGAISIAALTFAGPANKPVVADRSTVVTREAWSDRLPVILWSFLFGSLCGHAVMHGLLRFPTDFDCLMYHMPLIDRWLQSGSLYVPDDANWFLAANSELLGAWMVGPFSGDYLIALNNVPVMVVWAAAGLSLGRQLGMTGWWPHLATLSMLSVHTTLHETDDASNDLMVVAFCLAVAVYTLRYLVSHRTADLVLCGVCLGLLAGVKYFALGYAAVCFATFVFALILTDGWRESLRASAIVALVSIPFCGYWYIRNIVVTGLPLYPMGVMEGTESLGYPDIWSTSFWGNGHPELLELGLKAVWGMCGPIQYAAVVLTLAIVVVLAACSLKDRVADSTDRKAIGGVALALWIAGSVMILLITPFSVEDEPGTLNHLRWMYTPVRYGLCFLSFSVFGLFVLLHRLTQVTWRWISWTVLFASAVTCLWQIVVRIQYFREFESYFEVALIGFDVAIVLFLCREFCPQRWNPLPTGIAFLLVTASATFGILAIANRWHSGFAAHFDRHFATPVFSLVEESNPGGTSFGVYFYRAYPFFGSARQNRVVQPRHFESSELLDRLIEERTLQFVVARPDDPDPVDRYHGCLDYLNQNPQRFVPVGNGHNPQIFRVE